MLLTLLAPLALSCSIPNCETCSLSPGLCSNCFPGYKRSLNPACSPSLTSSSIENCQLVSSSSCLECSSGYLLISGRCHPECEENCICFEPNICINPERNLRRSYSSSSSSSSGDSIGAIVGSVVSFIIIVLVAALIWRRRRLRRAMMNMQPIQGPVGVLVVDNPVGVLVGDNHHDHHHKGEYVKAELNSTGFIHPEQSNIVAGVVSNPAQMHPQGYCTPGYAPVSVVQPVGYPPLVNEKITIDQYNFMNVVLLVQLDENNMYMGIGNCLFCTGVLTKEDSRILPCRHVFHGKCIWENMINGGNKVCPFCKAQYY